MKTFYFQTEVKSVERVADGVKIKGFASTPDLDRQYDIVVPTAFKRSLDQYIKDGIAPALLRSHDSDEVVGKILMDGEDAPVITDSGLVICAIVTDAKTAAQVEAGEMQTFSIGYIPAPHGCKYEMRGTGKFSVDYNDELKVEVRIINDLDWIETSIVSTPANPKAIFSLAKSAKSFFDSFPSSLMKKNCEFCPDKKSACGMIGKKNICSECVGKMEFKGEASEKVQKGATMHSVIFSKEKFDKDAATKVCSEKGFNAELCSETDKAFVFGQMEEKIEAEKLETATSDIEGVSFLMVKAVEEEKKEEVIEKKEEEKVEEKEEEKKPSDETVETPAEKQDEAKPEEGKAEDGEAEEKVIVSPEQKETLDYLAKVFTEVSQKTAVKTETKKVETKEEKKVDTETKVAQSTLDLLLPILSAVAQKLSHFENAVGEIQELMTKLPAPRGKGMIAFQHSITVSETKAEPNKEGSLLNAFKQARQGKSVSIGSDE
jgi:hypothetical protein